MRMEGRIEGLAENGLGILKDGRRKIHVPFTAPGDRVRVTKLRRIKRILIAEEFELIEGSGIRIEPRCPYFGLCGGCLLQHVPYREQLSFKRSVLEKALDMDVSVIPSPKIFGHRNRVDVVISTKGVGFRRYGTWWDVVDIESCPVFGEASGRVLRSLRDFMADFNLPAYGIRENSGFLRYIVIREGKFTGELMVNLVTKEGSLPGEFPEYFPYATSIYWSVNRSESDVSYGDVERFWGAEFIRETLGDVTYLIHPNSFFQTNSYQAVNLLKTVASLAEGEMVLDLYSGVGTFGVYLAKRGFKVRGIEVNPFAVRMANLNSELNSVEAEFEVGEDRKVEDLNGYDTVIVDPPRAGLHPRLVKRLLKDKPENLIYVSCNPRTLSMNLRELRGAYRLEEAVGLDMFPHTPHVEVVVKLKG